jgi:hypothetical protein
VIGANTLATPPFWLFKQVVQLTFQASLQMWFCAATWSCSIRQIKAFSPVVVSCLTLISPLVEQAKLVTQRQDGRSGSRMVTVALVVTAVTVGVV